MSLIARWIILASGIVVEIWPGNTVSDIVTFIKDGQLYDPDELMLTVIEPNQAQTTTVYNTDINIQRLSLGRFVGNFLLDRPGRWKCYWESLFEDELFKSAEHIYSGMKTDFPLPRPDLD